MVSGDPVNEPGAAKAGLTCSGHGTADKPTDPAAYDELEAVALASFPDEPVDAIGFSMGARVLLHLASAHPGRFRRLVTGGVADRLLTPDPERSRTIRDAVAGNAAADDPVATYFGNLADADDIDRDALVAFLDSKRPRIDASTLAAIECPTLVVVGDQDFAGAAEPLAAAIAGATWLTLPGVDHFGTPKQFSFIDAALEFIDARPF